MKGDEPAAFAEAAELRRLLQQLGQDEQPSTRDADQENAREARMAARMDAELAGLVKARRWRRRALYGVASAAALVALTLGARHVQLGAGSLAISAEPVSGSKPSPQAEARADKTPVAAGALAAPSAAPRPSAAAALSVAPSAIASAPEPQSTLAEENQLFKDAAEAGRNGDVNGAVSRLDKLLVEYPASPLAQTALVRKFRLLAKAGRTDDARREAERYLNAFPTGFAVSEARALQAAAGEQGAP